MSKVVKLSASAKVCPGCEQVFQHNLMMEFRTRQYPRRLVCVDCFAKLKRQETEDLIAFAYEINAHQAR